MRKKNVSCKKSHCTNPAEVAGFCQKHYDEHIEAERCQSEAINVLHFGTLEGKSFQNKELADEFRRLQVWCYRACDSITLQREDPILRDEAEFASSWCISLAQIIIREEKASRLGDNRPFVWDNRRDWVWERFKNLEAGLASNGVARRLKK